MTCPGKLTQARIESHEWFANQPDTTDQGNGVFTTPDHVMIYLEDCVLVWII